MGKWVKGEGRVGGRGAGAMGRDGAGGGFCFFLFFFWSAHVDDKVMIVFLAEKREGYKKGPYTFGNNLLSYRAI